MTSCVCVYMQSMSRLCSLLCVTAQTDGVWPLVWTGHDEELCRRRGEAAAQCADCPNTPSGGRVPKGDSTPLCSLEMLEMNTPV